MARLIILSIVIALHLCGLHPVACSQSAPSIEWSRCLGGTSSEEAYGIDRTTDGGFIVTGHTFSTNFDVSGPNQGLRDLWVLKLSADGMLEWEHTYGGSGSERGLDVKRTSDGGYIVVGWTDSNDGDVVGQHGGTDVWVLKLDPAGLLQWQRCLGGSSTEEGYAVIQTDDGGYMIAGPTLSNDGDVNGCPNGANGWLTKLDQEGNLQWQRCFGGPGNDSFWTLTEANDGGYVLAGGTNSYNTPIVPGVYGPVSFWILKLDAIGNFEWERVLGGSANDNAFAIQQTPDGGYLAAGYVSASSGIATCSNGDTDVWLVKLDADGVPEWNRCFGGTSGEIANGMALTAYGTCLITGLVRSTDGDVQGHHGGENDGWLLEVDATGELLWQRCIGGSGGDYIRCITPIGNDGFAVAGSTNSTNGDVNGFIGGTSDVWVVKFAPLTTSTSTSLPPPHPTLTLFPNPTTNILHVQWSGATPRSLEVLDISGRVVYGPVVSTRSGQEGFELQVAGWAAGLYTVCLQSANSRSMQRFVKE